MNKKAMLWMLAVFVALAMLTLAVAGRSRFPLVSRAVTAVVLPAEAALTGMMHAGDSVRGYWRALTVLQSENEQLKKENNELRRANITFADLYAENKQLRELLDYKEAHRSQRLVPAKVIARNFGDLRDSFYIDAGSSKGLSRDMAVVHDGLVGVIDEVYEDYAKVLLITSPRCKVGARILRSDSRAVGVAGGRSALEGRLVMEHLFREASVRENDVVVTSGFSGSHPEGILIGRVTAVHSDSVGLLQEAEVQPSSDVAAVEQVLVISEFVPGPKIERREQGGQAK